ncbi:WYL domain-containing protein [Bosea sp. CCNWLW174]
MEFLEWKMFWEGRVIRNDLESTFDISTPQASVDLRRYRELVPDNMEQTARGYRPATKFLPHFLKPSADRLLLQLRAFLSGVIPRNDIWFKDIPDVAIAPDIARDIPADCLRSILRVMRDREAIEIRYQSLTSSRRRVIAPHALAHDGFRWHVRAWCCENLEFRDFVLSRMDEFGATSSVEYDPGDDAAWHTKVVLHLRPHRGLSDQQRSAIEKDFGMTKGRRDIEMPACLAYYFIRRLNLDLPPDGQLTPERLQIELDNLDEVDAQIDQAKARAKALISKRFP